MCMGYSIAAGMLCDCRETKPGICGRVEEEKCRFDKDRKQVLEQMEAVFGRRNYGGDDGECEAIVWKARVG